MTEGEEMLDALEAEPAAEEPLARSDLAIHAPAPNLGAVLPKSGSDLMALSKQVAESRLFGNMTAQQAFAIAVEGAYLGIPPFTAFRQIVLINGKPTPSALLLAALIRRSPLCAYWNSDDSDERHCTIRYRRSDEAEIRESTTLLADVPPHLAKKDNYRNHPGDMIYAWNVRRIAKRHFPEVTVGLAVQEHDPRDIIDVEAVQAKVGRAVTEPCRCGAKMELTASSNGGTYLRCAKCGRVGSPPQDVRDVVRGTKREHDAPAVVDVTPAPPAVMADDDEPGMTATEQLAAQRRAELRKEVAEMLVSVPLEARNRFLDAFGAPGGEERTVWFREIDDEDVLIALRDGFASYREHEEKTS